MSSASNHVSERYHYAANGVTQGPFTAGQLKQLADAGQIQPQTLVWKEGLPEWVPASRFKGLLPAAAAGPEIPAASQTRLAVLLGVIGGGVALLAFIVLVVVFLLLPDSGRPATDSKDLATDKTQPPAPTTTPPSEAVKKSLPSPPLPPPRPKPSVEMTAFDLLRKFQKDPQQTLAALKGKQVLLRVEATWDVESVEKCMDGEGNLRFTYGRMKDRAKPQPNEAFCFRFPLADAKEKLSFMSKIKEYAEKQKRGDTVFMQVTGTVGTMELNGKPFLLIDQAVLN